MKKLIILSTIALVFFACSVNEKPEFLRVENIKVLESTKDYVTLTADALFINPNDISGQLKTDGIKVFVNDNEMASVSTESFKVPAKKEFSIPLKANIPADSIFSGKSISGLIGSLISQKLKVQYVGDIKYKILGFSHTYTIDKTEQVKIKL
ncbi:LEA type 2 family protein [Ichthyenterobacterium magnum]|uniref:Late embryogenesis abundant protein n=1 Tax=Ichthyenterobacterium magnum TaxID=1230530 RepID=A0A420DLB3_9FLAO|nr:LEA type 2 family protein [Ichthyenterobacterium magnum]RKE95066.1 late embryogenesis abundant protein [Ichthyenterobacterium magnum]